jgi:methyl-accepting chemotaxis protein
VERINRWLARLKIAHKLILSGVVFALPIVALLSYVTRGYNRGIHTCEKEVAGTTALEVSPALLRDLRELESRASLRMLSGAAPQGDSAAIRKRVDDAMATLQDAAGTESKKLVARLSSLWRQSQERGAAMAARQQAAVYRQMVETASQLIPVILDESGLILDSELHTYYLMNVVGPLLLQSQAAVSEAGAVALKAKGRALDARELSQLNAQSGVLTNTIIPRMRYSLETALREDKLRHGGNTPFQRVVPPLSERYVERIADLSSSISRAAEEADAASAPERIANAAVAAENAGVNLGSIATKELRTLLLQRIADDKRSRSIALLVSLVCVALAAGVMVIVTRNITRPLNFAVKLTSDIAAGKVKEAFARAERGEFRAFLPENEGGGPAQTKDEICQLIRSASAMTESLNTLLAKVAQASNQVAGSASQMAAAVRQVEAAVSEQAASTNQVSATSREIYATAQDLARTMAGVTQMAGEAAETAQGGVISLEGIRGAIDELIHASTAMVQTFEAINVKTGNIDRVITTITRVANRTNLLSLNAAIEAEKAGEKAGGFSVVALEMRRLADQTAVAALDIEKQIREVQHAVRDGVSRVESYAAQTHAKTASVTDLSSGLGHVIEGTTKLGPEFAAVNNGMQMQSQGAGQIAEAMQQLRDAASQTKDSLAEFRQVAEDLESAVSILQVEVGRFATAS